MSLHEEYPLNNHNIEFVNKSKIVVTPGNGGRPKDEYNIKQQSGSADQTKLIKVSDEKFIISNVLLPDGTQLYCRTINLNVGNNNASFGDYKEDFSIIGFDDIRGQLIFKLGACAVEVSVSTDNRLLMCGEDHDGCFVEVPI